jgi:hypothetical protein
VQEGTTRLLTVDDSIQHDFNTTFHLARHLLYATGPPGATLEVTPWLMWCRSF